MLKDLSLHILKGETVGLLPLDNQAKNSLIDLLCFNTAIEYGRIYFGQELVNSYEFSRATMNNVYVIEQDTRLIQDLNVMDNIFILRYGYKRQLFSRRLLERQTRRYFSELGIAIDPYAAVADLTNLERCIVELVKAVVADAGLIILHDLSNFLSFKEIQQIQEIIKHYKQQGFTFLYAGNHHAELFPVCDRVHLIEDGKIVKVFDRDELGEENIAPYIISFDLPEQQEKHPDIAPILRFDRVDTEHCRELTFAVHKGECLTFLDVDNKAMMDIQEVMCCGRKIIGGKITYNSKEYLKKGISKPIRNGIAVIQSNPIKENLFLNLSYLENLHFIVDQKIKKQIIKKSYMESVISEYHDYLGDDIFAHDIGKLEQKSLYNLIYYRIRLLNPQIVFCIQPFGWGDMYLRRHILGLIDMLKSEGITVIILTANIADTLNVADRLLMMNDGRIEKEYTKEQFHYLQEPETR